VPGHTIETYPKACEAVIAAGHEIAHHGWTHRPPASLTRDEEEGELVRGNEAIRKLTGRAACGYRSPSWDLSPHSIGLFLKHGFLYMRDTMEWGVLTYTCHPFVIGRGARMMMLERVIRTAADGGAVFLTMEDAVREFQRRAGQPARAKA
jgi:peptidoglycan/xylan/chitin deacetylase (PgdA/CDA1 family)